MRACGQQFSGEIIERIRSRVSADPSLTRSALSREVCDWLDWRGLDGRRKEANCRTALLKLARRDVIALPVARRRCGSDARSVRAPSDTVWPKVELSLTDLGTVWLEVVDASAADQSRHWWAMMNAHHPLGAGVFSGIRYLVNSRYGYIGALSFGPASLRLAARDEWIGWNEAVRQMGLSQIVCNSRFLILPTVKVPHLASHVLGQAIRRLPTDWAARCGVRPVLVETFIDPRQHRGTCYRAANWRMVGRTTGRGRQDRTRKAIRAVKEVWVYPLTAGWRTVLGGAAAEAPPSPPVDWAEDEFGGCALGDDRLTRRRIELGRDFYAQPTASIPKACGGKAKVKAAYRFFDNKRTKMQTLLEPHYRATEQRVASSPVILAIQDTTTLNYTAHDDTEGLGPINTRADGAQGLHLHSTLAVTSEGTPLGLLHVKCLARDQETLDKQPVRWKRSIEDKESIKWLDSYQAAAKVQARLPGTRVVSVGDRESDVAELFELARDTVNGPALLVRARHNRALTTDQKTLWDTVEAKPSAGIQVIQVPRQGSRKARQAQLTIRFAAVEIRPLKGGWEKAIKAWAVLAQEENAPPAVKEPLEWMLLTTLPVDAFEQAVEKLQWYAKRWTIEVMHRILKSGCRVEERQLARADSLEACLAIDLVVAWRIHYLNKVGRETPDVPCSVFFEDDEWKALMVYTTKNPVPPATPPTLREAIHRTAGLGGFLGRKSDGEPGTQTLWLGLSRLVDITAMWRLMALPRPPPESSDRYG